MRIRPLFENPYLDSVLWRIPTWIPSPQHTPFQIPSFWKNMSKFRPSGMYLTEIRRNSTTRPKSDVREKHVSNSALLEKPSQIRTYAWRRQTQARGVVSTPPPGN